MDQNFELEQAISEMLTPRFLQENTRFPDRETLFAAAGIPSHEANSALAERLRSEAFTTFLSQNTPFDSFEILLARASDAWISRSLFGAEVDMEAVQERSTPK